MEFATELIVKAKLHGLTPRRSADGASSCRTHSPAAPAALARRDPEPQLHAAPRPGLGVPLPCAAAVIVGVLMFVPLWLGVIDLAGLHLDVHVALFQPAGDVAGFRGASFGIILKVYLTAERLSIANPMPRILDKLVCLEIASPMECSSCCLGPRSRPSVTGVRMVSATSTPNDASHGDPRCDTLRGRRPTALRESLHSVRAAPAASIAGP